jgi:hypothetical protein
MNKLVATAGMARGKVKRKEYLEYLKRVRDRESMLTQLKQEFEEKTIEEIRAEFESQKGSIYVDL